ncbi:MAG TPA: hypothetical protein VII58_02410 [Acidobacteriaceae bacterium]
MGAQRKAELMQSGPRLVQSKPTLVPSGPEMILILKDTLIEVEREPEFDQRDPRVIEIKRSIRRSLAELESERKAA